MSEAGIKKGDVLLSINDKMFAAGSFARSTKKEFIDAIIPAKAEGTSIKLSFAKTEELQMMKQQNHHQHQQEEQQHHDQPRRHPYHYLRHPHPYQYQYEPEPQHHFCDDDDDFNNFNDYYDNKDDSSSSSTDSTPSSDVEIGRWPIYESDDDDDDAQKSPQREEANNVSA
jgi:hypothetical protein